MPRAELGWRADALLVVRGVKRDADEENRYGKHQDANENVHL